MNPLKRIHYNAPVTLTFAFFSLAALVLAHFTQGDSNYYIFSTYRASPADPLMYLRMFGHVLGHDSIGHYFNNFVIILLVGPMLEEKYGGKNIFWMIVITAFVTGLLFMAFTERTQLLGASGIVYMMILLSSFANWRKGRIPLTLILALVIFIGREVIANIDNQSNISHMTHIIGGMCGAVFGFAINRGGR